jgi:hypothetical protein
MTHVADDSGFPALFAHLNRADWGVSVLSGQRDGKRRYLFESGEERTMGAGTLDLMRKIEQPSSDQRATYARLVALLAKRERRTEPPKAPGATAVVKQLERFHKKYANGFFGKEWKSDKTSMHARQARGALVEKAQELFSKEALTKLEAEGSFGAVWEQVVTSLAGSGLISVQLKAATHADQQRALSGATLELLYGSEAYEQRFDRWVAVFESSFHEAPSWETATALPALVTPLEHIPVDPPAFRKQLKALSRYSSFGARPVGSAYVRCLTMAQALANMLAERGEVPRDLLDVHDFIRVTQTAPTKAETAAAAAAAPRRAKASNGDSDGADFADDSE